MAPPQAPPADETFALAPADRTVALNLGATALLIGLVVVAIAFNWVALKGVIVVGLLSVALAYLVLPVVQTIRRTAPAHFGGWRPSRVMSVLIVYTAVGLIVAPFWAVWGGRVVSQVPDVAREVPRQVARFVSQVRASERWHEQFSFERETRAWISSMTQGVSSRLQTEVAEIGAEVVRARLVVPWLAGVPILTLLLVSHWPTLHHSAARAFPTPHLKWRIDQLLRQVNVVLAAYTRAQALSALIIGILCSMVFALLKLPNAAMLGIVAGFLEVVPVAGPLAVAISATSVAASNQVVLVLAFLGALRIVQDYVIYPRLIQRALHLHPIAVVLAIWMGAILGGVLGVCLAVPTVGIIQVAFRHYREYSAIERLVREHAAAELPPQLTPAAVGSVSGTPAEAVSQDVD